MKKILLLGASTVMTAAIAAPLLPGQLQVGNGSEKVIEAKVKPVVAQGHKVAPGLSLSTADAAGRKLKSVKSTLGMTKINPVMKTKAPVRRVGAPATLPEGISFMESFEGWDGETLPWTPEGWTLDSKTGQTGVEDTTWGPCGAQALFGVYPADGETMMSVSFYQGEDADKPQDEWLVSPSLTVGENEQLKFFSYIDPLFLFSLDNFDFDNYEFVGDRQVTYTLKVLVKEENADWQEIWDASTEWLDVDVMDMLYASPSGLQEYIIPLTSFEGKTVQIAFQFVGKDANTLFLDMVTVGLPQLDGVAYEDPAETLYWGFDRSEGWRSLNASIAQYPVYAPVTWVNTTEIDGASFQWEYCDPVTAEWITSDEDNLTVTYIPDYSSEASTRNNWFYAPRLNASAPGATSASFQSPYTFFQAGGKPERLISGELMDFGLVPFDSNIHGLGFIAMEADFGQPSTPIFGYDSNSDAWWLNYTFNGDTSEASESDHVYVDAIMNYLVPGTAPMVITGANVLAKGQISDEAEFKLEIIALDDDGVPMMETPVASAVCKGEDVLVAESGMQNFLNVIFDFETPVVINPGDNGYMARFSGFHDPENIEYFAPMQSVIPFTHMNALAWLDKCIKIQGATEYRHSYTPTFYHESEYGMCHNAFAINLSAYHPWLVAETEEIAVPADGTTVEVPLDSYYDGADLTVEAPAGVTATVTGRYGECKLVVSHNDADVVAEGVLTVAGPGVKKVFTVSETSGVEGVGVDKATQGEVVAAFTVTGQPVSLDKAAAGVYVVKYSDGSARKISVK